MNEIWLVVLIAFVMAASLAAVVGLLADSRNRRLKLRLQSLASGGGGAAPPKPAEAVRRAVESALPKMGEQLMPTSEAERTELRSRLLHAGLYKPQAMLVFLGAKLALLIAPALLGLIGGLLGLYPVTYGLMFGGCASVLGMIGPSLWLDRRKRKRQRMLRRALPDATDLIVICMEGGLSLSGALRRVAGELRMAHPILADELNIVQREVQLGEPLADALSGFANRADLAELQTLAAVVKSAEQYGSSIVKSLQNYSETVRLQRQQLAEEMAQRSATKILLPTLLFIFPSILIIILGPAAIQIAEAIKSMRIH
ncbi:MAG TPA: type II secretion system F family protein [Pirellulales bacterium]|nr:type II secretion system F family protein [Pirellulales bacterium]